MTRWRTRRLLAVVVAGALLLLPARAALAPAGQPAAGLVALSPTTGVPGTVVQVTGSGFQPGESLLLRWDRGIGQVTVTVAGDGTFQAALLIFRKDVVGPRRLLVEPAGQAAAAATTTSETTTTTEATGAAQAAAGSTTTTEAAGATATTLLDGAAAADATTFLVLPTRQNPALGGAATQGR